MSASERRFNVWGCRGGRNAVGSRIGNHTSCYTLHAGEDLFVFDAGRGLHILAEAVLRDPSLQEIRRVHILVTHAHMDHWEGLKDAAWMWPPRNRLEVSLIGPTEALSAIRAAHAPPSFVELDVLASIALQRFAYVELAEGAALALPGATLRGVALHHYSGMTPHRHYVDTLGYHLTLDDGPRIAYLSDHEPMDNTRELEDQLAATSDLTILDANYANLADHAFGHGSVEYAAALARRHPALWVLASHHGPMRTDDAILGAHARHGTDCPNLSIAVEGKGGRWDAAARRFVRD